MAQRDLLSDLVYEVTRYRDLEHLDRVLKDHLGKLVGFYLGELRQRLSATDLGRNWPGFYTSLRDQQAAVADELPPVLPETTWEDLPRWQTLAQTFLTKAGAVRKNYGPKTGFPQGFSKGEWADRIARLPETVGNRLDRITKFPLPQTPPGDSALLFDLMLLISLTIEHYQTPLPTERRHRFC